jgi:hypothetical protein
MCFLNAVSRSWAAQQRMEQRLGGAQRLSDVARALRAAQGSPTQSDQVTRLSFLWFVSLDKQRNEHKTREYFIKRF